MQLRRNFRLVKIEAFCAFVEPPRGCLTGLDGVFLFYSQPTETLESFLYSICILRLMTFRWVKNFRFHFGDFKRLKRFLSDSRKIVLSYKNKFRLNCRSHKPKLLILPPTQTPEAVLVS